MLFLTFYKDVFSSIFIQTPKNNLLKEGGRLFLLIYTLNIVKDEKTNVKDEKTNVKGVNANVEGVNANANAKVINSNVRL